MNTWGVFVSFGIFQTHYVTALARSSSNISWIGSFQVFLLFFMGSVGGILTDAGYFRTTVVTGVALIILGAFATSVSTAYWQVFLAQGVCTGLGSGLIFTPVMAVISTYFSTKRAVALAVATCGSTVGGLIFPITIKPRATPHAKGPLIDWSAFKIPEYTLYAGGSFLAFVGIFFPIFYLATYARSTLGLTYTESLNLLLVLNGIGIIGRLAPSLSLGPSALGAVKFDVQKQGTLLETGFDYVLDVSPPADIGILFWPSKGP
ncbi:uncharacterized protein J7T54_000131 [Emericellopsis cladophorae]|uniref:Major facilitator superfamily (MFS) profile domain-containing protein n=1 Tax=Emericellopsis cladophorae TaxID=2686198 RepID=A0A9P9XZ22_9HYPO|nr:uncharacterized protein J7T54_000131 [Emericellopsis cladophorae]KAI6780492.1 hypothetical protein J7T54_000131 [Emericellopsis cladophorae]